jgi:transglutaminase-like putative cysteine protease
MIRFRRSGNPPFRSRLALFFILSLFSGCGEKAPEIESIDPRIGIMGGTLSIAGKNFGAERNESYITIAGTVPTSSSYIAWQDDLIRLKIPEFGDTGLVYVHTRAGKSNGALFSNAAAIPRSVQGTGASLGPQIVSVNPPSGSTGSLVTITGSGFGSSRERSGVFFAWEAEAGPSAPAKTMSPESVEVSEAEFGYELWSEREIRVRIPDGAVSGSMEVRTPRGSSRPFFFEISGKPGMKVYREKRRYTISYSVDIKIDHTAEPNSLYLWVPQPIRSASQRNVELLSRSMEPFVENHRGTTLFQLNNLKPGSGTGISLNYMVEVYSLETGVRLQSVRQDGNSPVEIQFTQPSPLIPSDDQRIITQAEAITSREKNPYVKAQRIYEWLIGGGMISGVPGNGGVLEALQEKQADAYQAALLFCALARAAGVPCIPAAGVLVNRNGIASRHYWAEFWIDGFGWIPVDPALGAGAAPADFNLRSDRAAYYFGNLDNQRIAFSRGQTRLSRMDPRGRASVRTREYALQNLWEEATGGLESYSSLWGDITVTGIYAQ